MPSLAAKKQPWCRIVEELDFQGHDYSTEKGNLSERQGERGNLPLLEEPKSAYSSLCTDKESILNAA